MIVICLCQYLSNSVGRLMVIYLCQYLEYGGHRMIPITLRFVSDSGVEAGKAIPAICRSFSRLPDH